MENGVFQRSAVAEELTHFVEARLHVDGPDPVHEQEAAFHLEMNQTTSRPYYVVTDATGKKVLGRFDRGLVPGESPDAFIDFLRRARNGG